MSLITLDPTSAGTQGEAEVSLAPRPANLDGQTIGIVMNHLADCELMFDALYAELADIDDVADVVKVEKDSQAVPPNDDQWATLDRATVAITGFGGCGSCSTRSMRDAIDLEERGVPAVCVAHTALEPAVRAIAGLAGRPDYPVVTVDYPHAPLATWTKQEAEQIARDIAADVRARLVR